ncbi:TIGR03084 family metal-binding protein [Actinocorallia sp. A-T 12471]|uniref:TIGR03084 family metal-binding protein n=1 Tax=Actinocorallia sp. A-T 12471 TaxID=3089813 RepID=UPI0029D2D836|nr:TIGR03084 family metal-binding protein [Actinocorallia sp. A-T 12471]MDX6741578.1 TIGR03084 family metal-binding protein [Actinocorallia sp. A-T 12471]
MSGVQGVFADLARESEVVEALVGVLEPGAWESATPAPGWNVAQQVAHLCFIFRLARLAAEDADEFARVTAAAQEDFDGAVNAALDDYAEDSPERLMRRWREERSGCVAALAAVPDGQVVPWLVNPLPPVILACAGIMELFAHGQDIADALGVAVERTDRIEHLVGFAALTWQFGYQSRGLTPPDVQFRYEITLPSGRLWEFGPEDSAEKIIGPAEDFCLLVTRRRHRADLAVTATGPLGDAWLDLAQSYRGPAGEGRAPGQFRDAVAA